MTCFDAMKLSIEQDIESLFTLRYIYNDPTDIVDIRADIEDLRAFPERLNGSYCDEWVAYLRRKLKQHQLNTDPDDILNTLTKSQREEHDYLLSIIQDANIISSSNNIKVIKSPLKTYIEQLVLY